MEVFWQVFSGYIAFLAIIYVVAYACMRRRPDYVRMKQMSDMIGNRDYIVVPIDEVERNVNHWLEQEYATVSKRKEERHD